MKQYIPFFLMLAFLVSCKRNPIQPVTEEPALPGGKGGSYAIAMFPVSKGSGVSGKCYIRYASKTIPVSLSEYHDSSATMVEPGFGPHVHFAGLKPGFYVLGARGVYNSMPVKGDTVIEIKSGQAYATDLNLTVR